MPDWSALPVRLKRALARRLLRADQPQVGGGDPVEYWSRHNVTGHHQFTSADESLDYFHWRNSQYPGYLELMPVAGFDGRRVLDFGCGPGNDLVGFGTFSRCSRLVGIDVAAPAVAEAKLRLGLHQIQAEVICHSIDRALPFADASFDHIHSSGVLHHIADPVAALAELRRVLAPGGSMNVMIYNYDSLWMHLKVAYHRTLVEGLYPALTATEQFARSTDGEACPISRCYRPDEWVDVCRKAGFAATFAGAAVSLIELSLLPSRFAAIMDRRLPRESREFLGALRFDDQMMPTVNGHRAGIDAVYHLTAI